MRHWTFITCIQCILCHLFCYVLPLSAQTDTVTNDSTSPAPIYIWTQPKEIKYFNSYEIQKNKMSIQFDEPVEREIDSIEVTFLQDPFQKDSRKTDTLKDQLSEPIEPDLNFLEHLFSTSQESNSKVPSWLIFHLLLITCLFAILYTIYHKYILQLFRSFILFSAKSSGLRDARSVFRTESLLTYFFFTLSYGTFFFVGLTYSRNITGSTILLTNCISTVALIYVIKHLVLFFLAWLLPFSHEFKHYELIISTTNKIIGIYVLPFLFVIGYTSGITQMIGLIICCTGLISIYLYRLFISLRLSLRFITFYKFHFFIYLCTIEIAPFAILLKQITIY